MALKKADQPRTETSYPLTLGSSLSESNSDSPFYIFRYKFVPQGSKPKESGSLYVADDKVYMEYEQPDNPQNPYLIGKGTEQAPTSQTTCVLIFDGEKFHLERVGTSFGQIKKENSPAPLDIEDIKNTLRLDTANKPARTIKKSRPKRPAPISVPAIKKPAPIAVKETPNQVSSMAAKTIPITVNFAPRTAPESESDSESDSDSDDFMSKLDEAMQTDLEPPAVAKQPSEDPPVPRVMVQPLDRPSDSESEESESESGESSDSESSESESGESGDSESD